MVRLNVKAPNMLAHGGVSFAGADVIATSDGVVVRSFNPPAYVRAVAACATAVTRSIDHSCSMRGKRCKGGAADADADDGVATAAPTADRDRTDRLRSPRPVWRSMARRESGAGPEDSGGFMASPLLNDLPAAE